MLSRVYIFFALCFVSTVHGYSSAFDNDLYENVLDSELCEKQLELLSNHSLRFQFLDASAKLPSGMLTGNLNDFGDYYQCLSIKEIVEELEIHGKYCTILVPFDQNPVQIPELPELPELPEIPWPWPDNETVSIVEQYDILQRKARMMSGSNEPVQGRVLPIMQTALLRMNMAVCVPKVCTSTQALNYVLERLPFVNLTFEEYYCRLPNDKPFVPADYVATVFFSVILILCFVSTAYDLHRKFVLKTENSSTLLSCFSVYTNTRRFLTFKSTPGALECVDGIRAISMMWVVVGHTYCLMLTGHVHNLQDTLEWTRKFTSTWIISAPITVDTFFLLSGILCVYTTVGKISKSRFVRTIHLFYMNRLLRMFPLLAVVILLQASVFHHVADGPFWRTVAVSTENCRIWWWSALLHVQNYVNNLEMCLNHTWYLSVDVQLYIVCPLVMFWLFGAKRLAWCALVAFLLLSLLSSSLYSFLNNYQAALFVPSRLIEFETYMTQYYINTLARAPPFFVGMTYGYVLHLCQNRKLRLPKLHVSILWILSFAMMAFCIFSMYPVMQLDHDVQAFDNFLNAYMRAIWALGLGWLIFACVHGYGGPINWFLSLQMWKLPARLSYAMYLVHMPLIMIVNGTWVKTYFFTEGSNIYRFASDLMFTFIIAFVLCIFIDAPFSTLQKLLLGGGGKKKAKPETQSQENIIETRNYLKTSL